MTGTTISVIPEGREDVWLADRESLKSWIVAQQFDKIHNFGTAGPIVVGADHDVASVLDDIDAAERVAILTGEAMRGNMNHALALIVPDGYKGLPERLEMYDIGDVTERNLKVSS